MISIIITSYNEPKSTEKAINALLSQNIEDSEIIVSDPFEEVLSYLKGKFGDLIRYDLDFGEGKSAALNRLINEVKSNIIICTDGDVYTENVKALIEKFRDSNVGCVCGRPVSVNSKDNMIGYWSHFLFDVGAHEISRKRRYENNKFIECSGYLFGFRNNVINEFSLDVAEDCIIPYLFFKKGYKIAYAEDALVYVKNPEKFKEFVKQRKRAADAHSKLPEDFPKVKSFFGEVKSGFFNLWKILSYPKSVKEFTWTFMLFPVRIYIWISLFYDLKIKKDEYQDGWRENKKVEGTNVEEEKV